MKVKNVLGSSIAAGVMALFVSSSNADEQTASVDGYSNYYLREGTFDWAKNCRLVAELPNAGTQLPAPVRLKFVFEHDQERLNVFQAYSARTSFDLGTYTDSSAFTYHQRRLYPSVSGRIATLAFNPFELPRPGGSSSVLKFEIYGDCELCTTNEARPPDQNHTSWRIFGTIEVETDGSGQVVTCRITDAGSQEPDKQLPSQNPQYYPSRMAPRDSRLPVSLDAGVYANEGTRHWNKCCVPYRCSTRIARCRGFRYRR